MRCDRRHVGRYTERQVLVRRGMNGHRSEIVGRGVSVILPHGVTLLRLGEIGDPAASGRAGEVGTWQAGNREASVQLLMRRGNYSSVSGRCAGRQHIRPIFRELLQLPVIFIHGHGVPQYDAVFITGDGGCRYTSRQYHGTLRIGSSSYVTVDGGRSDLGLFFEAFRILVSLDGTAESLLIFQREILLDGT